MMDVNSQPKLATTDEIIKMLMITKREKSPKERSVLNLKVKDLSLRTVSETASQGRNFIVSLTR